MNFYYSNNYSIFFVQLEKFIFTPEPMNNKQKGIEHVSLSLKLLNICKKKKKGKIFIFY